MPRKSSNILKNRKPAGFKETIRQAAADLARLQLNSSNSQVVMMSKPVISTTNGPTPSHHQQPATSSQYSLANVNGQPAAVTSNSSPADPNLTNPQFYTIEALEESVNFEELLRRQLRNICHQ